MEKFEKLGKSLSKQEQRVIYGGDSPLTQFLDCKVTAQSEWVFVESYGNNALCHSEGMPIYCYDGGPYEICRCFGNDTHDTLCYNSRAKNH